MCVCEFVCEILCVSVGERVRACVREKVRACVREKVCVGEAARLRRKGERGS